MENLPKAHNDSWQSPSAVAVDDQYKIGYANPNMAGDDCRGITDGGVVIVVTDPVSHADDEQLVDLEVNSGLQVDGEANWLGRSFSEKKIRQGFIRKVFLILTCQLAVTFGIICLFLFCEPINTWVRSPGNFWFYYMAYGVFLVIYFVLICCKSVRRQWPGNLICLALFTLSLSYMAGTLSSFHDTRVVLVAFGVTAAVCFSLALFAIQTKVDFTILSGVLFALAMIVIYFAIYCIITGPILGHGNHLILTGVYGALAGMLFSFFLVFDIQQVIGGKTVELNPEEYVYGALHIYLDVVILFIIILGCSGRSQ